MPSPWSRRRFLEASAASALALGAAGAVPWPAPAAPRVDEYASLRGKWRDLLLGSGFSPTAEPYRTLLATTGDTARRHLATMAATAGSLWPDKSYADPDPDLDAESYTLSGNMNESYSRLTAMARAYALPGTGLTGDVALREAVLAGLEHLNTDVFNEGTERYGNWWNWLIGAPQALMDTCVLLHEHLTAEQVERYCRAVDHFVPDPSHDAQIGTTTGANRVDMCRSVIVRGIVGGSAESIGLGVGALAPVFPYVASGDGFYADGSFIQHAYVPYIGGYGSVLHDGVGRLLALLRGSSWEVRDSGVQLFFDTVEKAIAPFVYSGLMMDNVTSRGISRAGGNDHARAHGLMATILMVGQGASAEENARWRAMVKGWMQRDYHYPALKNPGLNLTAAWLLQSLQDDTSVPPAPEPVEHRLFHHMDRVTHRRRGWCGSVSMASKRIAHYEFGNGENARGYHTGAGWLSWWGEDDLEQYSDAYWPTVDPYRLPGITASRKPLADGEGGNWGTPRPDVSWVGGTTDGEFGATGQHLRGLSSTMSARKSWFWLDDSVVCLGAGITSADGHAVETTVDNRHLGTAGVPALTVDGRRQPDGQGWSKTFEAARWAHIEGQAGYVFPGGGTVTALREERTGAWKGINASGPADPLTRRYLTLVHDHGTDPVDAAYAYVLLPGASAGATARVARDGGWMSILANSAGQQGIRVRRLGLTAVNFWSAGTLGGLTVSAPASVLVREKGNGTATIVVSDPARQATSLELRWTRPVRKVLSGPSTLLASEVGGTLTLHLGDLTKQAGAPQRITVRLA